MRLNPQYPPDYLRALAVSLFHQERYGEAIEHFRHLAGAPSDVAEDYATLVSALGHVGQTEGVDAAVERFNAISVPAGFNPLTVQEMSWWWYGDMFDYHDAYREQVLTGLRKAGIPEGAGTDLSYGEYTKLISKQKGEYSVAGAIRIDLATAKTLHDRKVTFIDVRSALAYERGRIPGAQVRNAVLTLSRETLTQVASQNTEVVFYCYGKYCPLSAYASAKALRWGYTRVYYFAGGYPAWVDGGYPVETGPTQ